MARLCECGKLVYAKGMCKKCYDKQHIKTYRETHPEYLKQNREGIKEWQKQHPEKVKQYRKNYYHKTHPNTRQYGKKTVCGIIKQHHEAMKDDPEHLTTEFIKKLIKVDCKEV